jgi:hypothetical protein
MLRFDIAPVCSNAYRLQALVNLSIAALYLFTPYKWVAFFLAFGGLIRGFVSPHKCLSYRLFAAVTDRLGRAHKVNAGSKMFADKMAAIMGTAMAASWLAGSEIGMVPATAVMIFATLDAVTGFCAACWAYGLWYKLRAA